MTRSLPEWVGKTPDTSIPPRVRLRVFERQGGKCGTCNRKMGVAGEPVEYDHVLALVNGGQNREVNLQALCAMCHGTKTRKDVAEKGRVARVRKQHLGISTTAHPLPGGKASKWKKKLDGTVVPRE